MSWEKIYGNSNLVGYITRYDKNSHFDKTQSFLPSSWHIPYQLFNKLVEPYLIQLSLKKITSFQYFKEYLVTLCLRYLGNMSSGQGLLAVMHYSVQVSRFSTGDPLTAPPIFIDTEMY